MQENSQHPVLFLTMSMGFFTVLMIIKFKLLCPLFECHIAESAGHVIGKFTVQEENSLGYK